MILGHVFGIPVEETAVQLAPAGAVTVAVFAIVFRQPGANIIDTVDRIQSQLPFLEAVLPHGIKTTVVMDRTTTIRASVRNVETTLKRNRTEVENRVRKAQSTVQERVSTLV